MGGGGGHYVTQVELTKLYLGFTVIQWGPEKHSCLQTALLSLTNLVVSVDVKHHVYLFDLAPKDAHARGYALQLKIKQC